MKTVIFFLTICVFSCTTESNRGNSLLPKVRSNEEYKLLLNNNFLLENKMDYSLRIRDINQYGSDKYYSIDFYFDMCVIEKKQIINSPCRYISVGHHIDVIKNSRAIIDRTFEKLNNRTIEELERGDNFNFYCIEVFIKDSVYTQYISKDDEYLIVYEELFDTFFSKFKNHDFTAAIDTLCK
jgi:hypothetical protein